MEKKIVTPLIRERFKEVEDKLLHMGGSVSRQYLNRREGFIAKLKEEQGIERRRAFTFWIRKHIHRWSLDND